MKVTIYDGPRMVRGRRKPRWTWIEADRHYARWLDDEGLKEHIWAALKDRRRGVEIEAQSDEGAKEARAMIERVRGLIELEGIWELQGEQRPGALGALAGSKRPGSIVVVWGRKRLVGGVDVGNPWAEELKSC